MLGSDIKASGRKHSTQKKNNWKCVEYEEAIALQGYEDQKKIQQESV